MNQKIQTVREQRKRQRKKLRLTRKGQVFFSILSCLLLLLFVYLMFMNRIHVKASVFEFSYEDAIPTAASYYLKGAEEGIEFHEEDFIFEGIGSFDKTVTYKDHEYTLHFNIIDDIAPEITIADEINLSSAPTDEDIYLINDISEYSVETNFKVEELQIGEVSITVTATDIYDNKSTLTKRVNVIQEEYNSEVLINLGISLDEDIEKVMEAYRSARGLNTYNFAMAYYNTATQKTYYYNENEWRIGGSIYKVPLNMLIYEDKNKGILNDDSELLYCGNCFEEGAGSTAYTYSPGNRVPLPFLQAQSILNSDNTASHILFEYYGYGQYREQIKKYSAQEYPAEFLNDNTFNARYMMDTLKYLYDHQNDYAELISFMKDALPNRYFKTYVKDYEIAHKYGEYLGAQNDVGIIYTPTPYLLVVMSNNEQISAEVNEIMCEYTLKHPN